MNSILITKVNNSKEIGKVEHIKYQGHRFKGHRFYTQEIDFKTFHK